MLGGMTRLNFQGDEMKVYMYVHFLRALEMAVVPSNGTGNGLPA